MWPIFVEFCSASSEIRGRKLKKKESVVKRKSADMYVGRRNKLEEWLEVTDSTQGRDHQMTHGWELRCNGGWRQTVSETEKLFREHYAVSALSRHKFLRSV